MKINGDQLLQGVSMTRRSFLPSRLVASIAAFILMCISLVALPAYATPVSVIVTGDFLDETTGCDDWAQQCTDTEMANSSEQPALYQKTMSVPAGSWEYKIKADNNWYSNVSGNMQITVAAETEITFQLNTKTGHVGLKLAHPAQPYSAADDALIQTPVHQGTDESFYFVLTDRFYNGDTSNDTANLGADRMASGFDPTNKGFYNGGDIAGLRAKLDYIQNMGITALWLTPSFKNQPVQGTGDNATAGYHGYWITDFTQIDPHLGTNEELQQLIQDAHNRGIKVYFDIIVNHTADLIHFKGLGDTGNVPYKSIADYPYTDTDGNIVDITAQAGKSTFPQMAADTSFPYVPERVSDIVPDSLNDVTLYHNRGNGTWQGGSEDFTFGDFDTLDDLMTENPRVIDAMTKIYTTWANFGIDGFRIDTAKHVNFSFWKDWTRNIKANAKNPKFFMFGEVYNFDPRDLAPYARNTNMGATLDFGWQHAALNYLNGGSAADFGGIYAADDLYTTEHSAAGDMPTFLGNHDMGRIGHLLNNDGDRMRRDLLGHQLMFLTRGQPVVYYGDEQGFVGNGSDREARQSLFASQVPDYQNQQLIDGSTLGQQDHFSESAPVYQDISQVAQLRKANKALRSGAQIQLHADNGPGIYAFARVDRDEKVEYLVAVNNTATEKSADFATLTSNATYQPLLGASAPISSTDHVSVTVPAFGAVVYQANKTVDNPDTQELTLTPDKLAAVSGQARALDGQPGVVTDLAPVTADIPAGHWAETSFAWRVLGDDTWHNLGVATGDKPRVFHDVAGLTPGTLVEYRAVSVDAAGKKVATSSYASVNLDQSEVETTDNPLVTRVFVPGDHNVAMGCSGIWQQDCPQAELRLDEQSGWYTRTFNLPPGDYQYKVALNGTWEESYGEKGGVRGVPSGDGVVNSSYHLDKQQDVTFFYNPQTHEFYNTAQRDSWTLPGTFNKALGCTTGGVDGGNWDPACTATLMADPDNDGVFIFETLDIPAGDHQVKAAKNFGWGNGEIGCPAEDQGNCHFTAVANKMTRFTLDTKNGTLKIESVDPTRYIEYQTHWLSQDTFAWPTQLGDDGSWELYWAANGGITTNDGIHGADGHVSLTKDPAGLSTTLKKTDPQLRDYTALHPETAIPNIEDVLKGQLVMVYTNARGIPLYAGGVQIPRVLDELYADKASKRTQGVSFDGDVPTLSLWAPTAKSVTLQLFNEPGDGGVVVGNTFTTHKMARQDDGSWTITGAANWKNRPYRYDVEVYVPEIATVMSQPDQKEKAETVQHNIVTDPNSNALAVDSQYSVIADLSDQEFIPTGWPGKAPVLDNFAQHAIYELQVRDFSIADTTVPEDMRGTYAAFAQENSAGMTHLRDLAKAGMNTIHLLPTNDIGSVPERRADQEKPQIPTAGPDSDQQQEAVMKVADRDGFNWGYDPFHYAVPEGSYAMAEDQYGGKRTKEYRQMVAGLHKAGYQVILDQVFNHTYSSGQYDKSTFDRVVPGYYYRLDMKGGTLATPCCSEVATEHRMAEDHMIDSLVSWAKTYKVDGFRFDLMGFHSRDTMEKVRAALDKLTLDKDGIDGKKMYLYGEGWNFGSVANDARFVQATQGNLAGTGIGSFNDRLRDGVHGHGDNKFDQGFGNGLATDPNGHNTGDSAAYGLLAEKTDLIRLGLAGNLRDYQFYTHDGQLKRGDQINYHGQAAGYASEPYESVNYIDAHDNEALYDVNVFGLPRSTSMSDRVRMNTLSLATVAMGQSPMFWHGGTDILRSKSLDRNSYNSGDYFNQIDWSLKTNNFGIGLPPKRDNESQWDNMRPLLRDTSLRPDTQAMQAATAQAQELLKLRSSSPLFTLGTAELIKERVTFPDAGSLATPGMIMMRISDPGPVAVVGEADAAGAGSAMDIDPKVADILVVFNATPNTLTKSINTLSGLDYHLSDIQTKGSDDVVKNTQWDATEGKVTIPARTVAVLVADQPDTVKPVITVDPTEVSLAAGDVVPALTDGVSATDNVDGDIATDDITVKIEKIDGDSATEVDAISTDVAGTYRVTYTVTDKAGNTAEVQRTYTVVAQPDTEAPVVTVDPTEISLTAGDDVPVLTDGVSATDNVDGDIATADITVKIEKIDGDSATEVDAISTDVAGTYRVTYTVTDKAGNTAEGQRMYTISPKPDTEAPVVTVDPTEISLTVGDDVPTLTDGVSATDNVDGDIATADITVKIEKVDGDQASVVDAISTEVAGTYRVTYTVTDKAGNTAEVQRTYTVNEASAEPGRPAPSDPTPVGNKHTQSTLPNTGVQVSFLALVALVCVAGGTVLTRRRRRG